MSREKRRELALKSFMLGVDWVLKCLVEGDKADPGIWSEFTEQTAALWHDKAEKVVGLVVRE